MWRVVAVGAVLHIEQHHAQLVDVVVEALALLLELPVEALEGVDLRLKRGLELLALAQSGGVRLGVEGVSLQCLYRCSRSLDSLTLRQREGRLVVVLLRHHLKLPPTFSRR